MSNNNTLDVIIGLVFIYLLYSLLATTIQEMIAVKLSFRGKFLEKAIMRMLDDDTYARKWEVKDMFQMSINKLSKEDKEKKKTSFSTAFYQHPLMKYLSEKTGLRKPAYIKAETFSKVVVDLLKGNDLAAGESPVANIQHTLTTGRLKWKYFVHKGSNGQPQERKYEETRALQRRRIVHKEKHMTIFEGETVIELESDETDVMLFNGQGKSDVETIIPSETRDFINSIWVDAQGDVSKFTLYLENWFHETMDRASGWYKRYTQFILLVVGLFVAVVFNVDTIRIAAKLQKDPTLRADMVRQADAFVKAHPNLDAELAGRDNATAKVLKSTRDSMMHELKVANGTLGIGIDSYSAKDIPDFLLSVLGWLITALAISLGAPFWFDLLNKFIRLRGSVAPSKPKDDKSKSADKELNKIKRVG